MEEEYIGQLTEVEKIVLTIAKNQLGTSFNLKKSIGYQNFIKKNLKSNS